MNKEQTAIWQDEILQEIYKIREENAKKFSSNEAYLQHWLEIEKKYAEKENATIKK
mgnify:CR=1 FL=1